MATAIFRAFTNDGFLIAADGRMQALDGTIISETKQKIFSFGGNGSLAYSFTGRVGLGPVDGPDVMFDFIGQFKQTAQVISTRRSPTLVKYAHRLTQHLQRVLKERCSDGRIKFSDEPSRIPGEVGSTIAEAMIDGYYSGLPSCVRVRFYRLNGQLVEPEITSQELKAGGVWLHGFEMVGRLLCDKDPRFFNETSLRRLDTPLPHFSPGMHNAVIQARAYIEGCSSPEGLALNSKIASSIGGRIHMASVTKKDGFK